MQTETNPREVRLTLFYALGLGVLTAIYRVLPHFILDSREPVFWNLVPMGALALFVGSRLRVRGAILLPLAAMLVSDLVLWPILARMGFQAFWLGTPIIYLSFGIYVLIGRLIARGELSPMVIGGAALVASLQFFLLTNFASWLAYDSYPRTLAGLGACYTAGLPFYRNTLVSDLTFSVLFFGLHAVLVRATATSKESQPA